MQAARNTRERGLPGWVPANGVPVNGALDPGERARYRAPRLPGIRVTPATVVNMPVNRPA